MRFPNYHQSSRRIVKERDDRPKKVFSKSRKGERGLSTMGGGTSRHQTLHQNGSSIGKSIGYKRSAGKEGQVD